MAIMQYFSKRFQKKKTVDTQIGHETLTGDYKLNPEFINTPTNRCSQRKWSETLSHICNEDNIFPDQFR